MAFRWIPMVLALTAGLTACAAAGRGDPNTIEPITTTPVTVAASTTVTTAPPTTTSTTTTTGSTTSTQVEDPQAATKQEIAEVVVAARTAVLEASYEPVDPNYPALLATHTTTAAKALSDSLSELANTNRAYRESDSDLESLTVVTVVVRSDTEATAVTCVTSDAVEYDTESGEVLNDDLVSRLVAFNLVQEDRGWVIETADTVSTYPGATECD